VTRSRSIAAAQTIPKRGDVGANIEQHLRLVPIAAQENVQVLVFPELSLTGYELDLASDLAFSEGDSRLAPLAEMASSCSVILVVGAPVRIGTRLHIGAFIVSPDRSVEVYTKHHLGAFSSGDSQGGIVPPAEDTVFHRGDRNPLVRFGGNTAAVAVCADTRHPSHARQAADRGATTYLAGSFTIASHLEMTASNLQASAKRHRMAVALANYGGPSGGLASGGGSAIWSENGELLAQLDVTGTGLVVATESSAGWRARTVMRGDL
jgi:predicted amidohydrolase